MRPMLVVGLGGALGAVARFGASFLFASTPAGAATSLLWINGAGSFLIGFVITLAVTHALLSDDTKLFWTTGFMGGFTTFSSFAVLSTHLLRAGSETPLVWLLAGSIVLALLSPLCGILCAHVLMRLARISRKQES